MSLFFPQTKLIALLFLFSLRFYVGFSRIYSLLIIGTSCAQTGNYTANSTYQTNLNRLLSTFNNKASDTMFYNSTVGNGVDKVFGLFQCRGDLPFQVCKSCMKLASLTITQTCPEEKEANIWYVECMIRYSFRSIFSIAEESPFALLNATKNSSHPQFNQVLIRKLDDLINISAYSKPQPTIATGEDYVTKTEMVHCLVECTPDITGNECEKCLRVAVGRFKSCCRGIKWVSLVQPSCRLMYSVVLFYETTNSSAAPSPLPGSPFRPSPVPGLPGTPAPPNQAKHQGGMMVLAIGVSIGAAGMLLLLVFFFLHKKRNRNKRKGVGESSLNDFGLQGDSIFGLHDIFPGNKQGNNSPDLPILRLDLILEATGNFSDENKLGEGGFGPVYKGVLAGGNGIAVKRLARTSMQGQEEFMNEITLIAKLQHKNLVRLLGCCLEGQESLLVYEYLPNKSLDFHLFDLAQAKMLTWKRRFHIINGIARGLLYLHEDSRLRIIHRDMKASNVLLDDTMEPKISDFGMARLFGGNQNESNNTNRVVGTYGYMSPEYAMQGQFSVKSDVFSFGVILLEIVSGHPNNSVHFSTKGETLLSFAWKMWSRGQGMELMDPAVGKTYLEAEVMKCIRIGLLCVQEDPSDRPVMSSVVVMLGSEADSLPEPKKPPFYLGQTFSRPESCSSSTAGVQPATFSTVGPR